MTEKGVHGADFLYKYVTLYDAAGNLCLSSEETAQLPGRTLVLTYDGADRLSGEYSVKDDVTSGTAITYTYDNSNNRLSKMVGHVWTIYQTSMANQLTSLSTDGKGSVTYTYDLNGNRATRSTGGVTENYTYDRENRLVSFTKGATGSPVTQHCEYAYDYRTRRVQRSEEGVSTDVVFSGGTSVQEYPAAGTTATVEYVRGSDWGGGVGGLLYSLRGGAPSFAHFNSRGDVVARTDINGALTYQSSYETDGQHLADAAKTFGVNHDRQQANTKEEDPTGLLNEGMRYRDLEAGVFITRDPAGKVDGPNQYAYVRQNPWSKFDPEGLESWADFRSLPNCGPLTREALDRRDQEMAPKFGAFDRAVVNVAAGFIPGVSQIQGVMTLRDSEATNLEKVLAVAGMVPEVGGIIKGAKGLLKGGNEVLAAEKAVAQASREVQAINHAEVGAKETATVTKIEGNAQKTSPGHAGTSNEVASEMANGSQPYDSVHLNQELKTITQGEVPSRLRPDVAGKRPDGKIDLVEIPSKSQTVVEMQNKIKKMEAALGDKAGPASRVEPIRPNATP